MKISKLKTATLDKPFFKDEKISLTFKRSGHKIIGIHAVNGNKTKEIPIVKDDIVSAFKTAEKFFAKIK